MDEIVVVGSSGHACSVTDLIEQTGRYRIIGLLDRFRRPGERAFGYEILGTDLDMALLAVRFKIARGVVAIGDNWRRSQCVAMLRATCPGLQFPSIVHPSAILGRKVTIGDGTVVMGGAVVNADTDLGEFSIINTRSSVDHEGTIGNYASLGPGATLGGRVVIGAYSAVCLGASVTHKVQIGAHTLVGAGAAVLSDLPAKIVAYGVPAHVIRSRVEGDPYL